MKRDDPFENVMAVVLLVVLVLGLSLSGAMKKWEYDECLKVGHGDSYCAAQAAGCFGHSSRSKN